MLNRIILTLIAAQLSFAAVNYSYDAGGRLVKVDYGAAGSINYVYDKAGNLLSRNTVTSASVSGTITSVSTAFDPASSGIAQNTWIQIQGTNLVPASTPAAGVIWSNAPEFTQNKMPTNLGGISVSINGKSAYIYFYCSAATSTVCSQDQINVLSPLDDTIGDVQVVVSNGASPTAPFTVNMHAQVPALFTFDGTHVVATHLNNSLVGPVTLYPGASTPAKPGESVVVYASGFGIPAGTSIAPGSSSQFGAYPTLPVCKIGSDNAAVSFAGLIGPGLVQINLTVPLTAASAEDSISCSISGAATPLSNVIAVQP